MKANLMKNSLEIVLVSAALLTQIGLFGQTAPPAHAPARPSAAIDLSGYWSPCLLYTSNPSAAEAYWLGCVER